MKYLRKFATKAEMDVPDEPNVVLVAESGAILYNVKPKGVYIQHIDGKLYATDAWVAKGFANDEANGVAVIANEASFVVAKEDADGGLTKNWGSSSILVTGIVTTTNADSAKLDYGGAENTSKIIAQLGEDTKYAAHAADAYVFPNTNKGYLPSAGEFQVVLNNKNLIVEALALIGGTAFLDATSYWSSTQRNIEGSWLCGVSSGSINYAVKYNPLKVRAFAPLNV